MGFARYAVYYTPAPGPFAEFCAAWLGWDSATGQTRGHPVVHGLPGSIAELTARPRKYGFHATLKPPFRLASGHDPVELGNAVARLAADLSPVVVAGLEPARLGGFVALQPRGDERGLRDLACEVVERLDVFRAPPTAEELARRQAQHLTPRQQELLARWGYPYTHDQFRFHMTLTGPLPGDGASVAQAALAQALAPLLPQPFTLDALTLLGADEADRFHQIARLPLGG